MKNSFRINQVFFVIVCVAPLLNGLFDHFLMGKRLSAGNYISIALGIIGLIVFIVGLQYDRSD